MENNRVKSHQGIDIVFYLQTKNYNYYRCPRYGCKGEYKENINSGIIGYHKRHSSKCYSLKKLETQQISISDNSQNNNNLQINNNIKVLNGLEREEKRNNNNFLKLLIQDAEWEDLELLNTQCLNKVYRLSNKYVAKILKTNNNIENLIKEAEIHLSINHPRIVNCLNYFYINGKFYLITEYCSKETLLFVQKDEEQSIRLLNQVIEALKFLHENKIAHRDIKLDNIFIDSENNVKLGDFGCVSYGVKFSDYKGTPSYMSPQIKENSAYTLKCDIWSLGITSYCLLSGTESKQSIDLIKFMQKLVVSKKCKVDQLEIMIVKKINELDFTGMSDKSKENIKKMLQYKEEDRATIFDIEF